jgi:hypothetical protein
MGRPNPMHNMVEKTFESASEKKKRLMKLTTKHPHLALHTTSNTFNVNQKINKKGYINYMKYFPKGDMSLF